MRILVLNQYFRPEVASSAQRISELVDDLAVEHDVTVIAGRASYDPEHGRASNDTSSPARVAGGSTVRNVRLVRVASTGFHRRRMAARVSNYVTYLASALFAGLLSPRADVVIAATDPPLVGFVGLCISRIRRSAFVHLLWDIQPQVALAAGLLREGAATRVLDRLNRLVLRSASVVIVPTREMKESAESLGVQAPRVAVLPHWEDTDAIAPQPKDNAFSREHGLVDRFVLMYSGNLGLTQRLDSCLALAARVRDLEDAVILIVGDGAARAALERRAAAQNLSNVRFLPYQRRQRLSESLGSADVCFAPLGAGLTPYMLPSKIFTVMAAGRPLLASIDVASEVADLIAQQDCGHVAPPGDLDALERSVRWFHGHPAERAAMGRRAREASERFWSRAIVTARYLEIVNALAANDHVRNASPVRSPRTDS